VLAEACMLRDRVRSACGGDDREARGWPRGVFQKRVIERSPAMGSRMPHGQRLWIAMWDF
jgi:hypothetical protein